MASNGSSSTAAALRERNARRGMTGRQILLLASAVLLVGGGLFLRFLAPLDRDARASELLASLGAELPRRALSQTELGFTLEPPTDAKGAMPQRLAEHVGSGDLVLLHFWASWCPPCLQEMPELLALARSMQGRRFRLVAVSYDDDWAAQNEVLLRVAGRPRPAEAMWLRDPGGQNGDPQRMLRTRLGTDQLPETYVIDDGRVVARFISSQQWTSPKMLRVFETLSPPR